MSINFTLKDKYRDSDLEDFSNVVQELSDDIGFKVSARGWAYILEGKRLINKNEFDKVATLINTCRKKGFLPIDFVAEEDARSFKGVERPNRESVVKFSKLYLDATKDAAEYYTPDWWTDETYYIQMVVEKIDLVTLFQPVCEEYHIAIANAKGWSSILQRAEYARRFKDAENKGLNCVLLYCGDHDPDGLRISEFIRKNLEDVKDIVWSNGLQGYNPKNLIIERFGLNYDFILDNNLTWIDNLITGSSKNLADPKHRNFKMPYVQQYLKEIGERKCEANSIVTMPRAARQLVRGIIEEYLGQNARERFEAKRDKVRNEFNNFLDNSGLGDSIDRATKMIDEY